MQIGKVLVLTLIVFCSCKTQSIAISRVSKGISKDRFRVCTQNLHNLQESKTRQASLKREHLANRFKNNSCDIIAVQEVRANGKKGAKKVLDDFSRYLSKTLARDFISFVGSSNDNRIYPGFIVDNSFCKMRSYKSYSRTYLPKIALLDRARMFSRGPFRVDLDCGYKNDLTLITFHFKSKSARQYWDSSGYSFELRRIRMAEALREIVEKEISRKPNNSFIVLGDRNSEPDSATALILEGKISFDRIKSDADCYIAQSGEPQCQTKGDGVLRSVYKKKPVSHWYRGKPHQIDDILFKASKNQELSLFSAGSSFSSKQASDHALLWAELKVN